MNLLQTQSLIYKFIVAPEGVSKALAQYKNVVLPLQGDERLSAAARLDIYANMYFYRILDSIKEDYPGVLGVIGSVRFHNLITAYLVKFPPTHFSLRNASENLPRFIQRRAELKKYPCLYDVSRFEWAMIEVFDAVDSSVMNRKNLAAITPEIWNSVIFSLIPAKKILILDYHVTERYSVFTGQMKLKRIKSKKNNVLLWRKDFKVYYRTLDGFEFKLLKLFDGKNTFGEICTRLVGRKIDNKLMARMGIVFMRWLDDGLVSCLHR